MYTSGLALRGLHGLRDGAGGSANIPTGFCCAVGYHPYFLPQGNSGDARFPYWTCQSDTNPKLGGAPVKCPDAVVGVPGSRGGSSPTTPTGGTGVTPYSGGATGTATATGKPCPIVPCARKPCPPCQPQPCEEQPCYETADSGGDSTRGMTGLRGVRGLRGCGCGGNCNRCRQASPCEWG